MLRKPMSMDDYFGARPIVDPFGLYDICLESDGACAVLVTSAERAKDMRQAPVYIMGGAYGGGPNQGEDLFDAIRWPDLAENYAKYIADDLWRSAGVGPRDVDVAEIYDCFTYSIVMALEGPGLLQAGRGRRVRRERRDPARRRVADQHARRPAVGGVHSRLQPRDRGRRAVARRIGRAAGSGRARSR